MLFHLPIYARLASTGLEGAASRSSHLIRWQLRSWDGPNCTNLDISHGWLTLNLSQRCTARSNELYSWLCYQLQAVRRKLLELLPFRAWQAFLLDYLSLSLPPSRDSLMLAECDHTYTLPLGVSIRWNDPAALKYHSFCWLVLWKASKPITCPVNPTRMYSYHVILRHCTLSSFFWAIPRKKDSFPLLLLHRTCPWPRRESWRDLSSSS